VASIFISSVELILDKLLRPTLISSLPPLIRLRQLASSLPVTRGNTASLLPVTVNTPEVEVRVLANIVSLTSLVEVKLFSDVTLTEVRDDVTGDVIGGDAIGDVINDVIDDANDVVDDDVIVDDMEVDAFTVEETVAAFSAKFSPVLICNVVFTVVCEVELFTLF
jgi:hypothetical protein